MPELAEVEHFRRVWAEGLGRNRIVAVHASGRRLFRSGASQLPRLVGSRLARSAAAAKQMLFEFQGARGTPRRWLGVHLGMSGRLEIRAPDAAAGRHDHLVLRTATVSAVYNDPRMFGRVDYHEGPAAPAWWTTIAPAILSRAFTLAAVRGYLARRRRAPIKAVLLQQERFPGIGNWMADEILWRAAIHPAQPAGTLTPAEVGRLWRQCREVCRLALRHIGGRGGKPPSSHMPRVPTTWLLPHRWQAGGRDPRTGTPLHRGTIGGRTTCWSPARQRLRPPGSQTPRPRP